MTSGSSAISSPVTTEVQAAPIWGRGYDALAEGPIGPVAVMSGTDVEDPLPVTASGASRVAMLAAATLSGARAPSMYATCGPYPIASLNIRSALGVGFMLEGDTLHSEESKWKEGPMQCPTTYWGF
jgi:hypothetical protein